jgi:hypothetical protein
MATTFITSTTELPRKRVPKLWSQGLDPSAEVLMYEDWVSATPENGTYRIGNNYWQWDTSGGSVSAAVGEQYALGVVQLSVTNGRAAVFQSLDGIELGGAVVTCMMRVKIPTVATAAQAFYTPLGLGDSGTAAISVDAVLFQHDQTTGNWLCKTRSNSSETSTTTTTAVTAGAWVTLKFVVDVSASTVYFYIGATARTIALVATHTTNIPKGTGRDLGPLMKIIKTNGNTTRTLLCDYYMLNAILGMER